MKVTLLQKKGNVAETEFRAELDRVIRNLIGKLFAKVTFHSFTTEGWSRVSIDGDDAEVAVELLSRKFGIAPGDIANVALHGNYRGVIRETSSSNLIVDIGINHPKPTFINVKLSALLAQLADGRQSTSIRKITQNYCLLPETPISIRVTRLTANVIEGWLSDSQISIFTRWITSGLERILVFDCLPSQLASVMTKA